MPYAQAATAVAVERLQMDDPEMRAATFLLFGSIAQVSVDIVLTCNPPPHFPRHALS